MINKLGITNDKTKNKAKQQNFTGNIGVIKKEMYIANDIFVKLFEKKSEKPFIEILSKLTRKSTNEIKQAFNFNDEKIQTLNESFRKITNDVTALGEFKQKSPELFKKANLEEMNFHDAITNFLKKEGITDSENKFDKLPAKLMVIGKGETTIADDLNLMSVTDKVVLRKGAELTSLSGQKVVVQDFDDSYSSINISSNKDLVISNSKVGTLSSLKHLYGSNLNTTGDVHAKTSIIGKNFDVDGYLTSQYGSLDLKGTNKISGEVRALNHIRGNNFEVGGHLTSDEGFIDLKGTNKIGKDAYAKSSIAGENFDVGGNLTSANSFVNLKGTNKIGRDVDAKRNISCENIEVGGSLTSKDWFVDLNGTSKIGQNIKAKSSVNAENIKVDGNVTSENGFVTVEGAGKIGGNVKAKTFNPSQNTIVLGSTNASTSIVFRIKNLFNKLTQ